MVTASSVDYRQPWTTSTALLVYKPPESKQGWIEKQIVKCKLYVTVSLYTVYSTSHHFKALDIFGFTLRIACMWCCLWGIILWKSINRMYFLDYMTLLYKLLNPWES